MTDCTVSLRSTRLIARGVFPQVEGEAHATTRQELIHGVVQEKLASSTVIIIGAGGIGGELAVSEARKGVRNMVIFDHDLVELSNLNRQRFFEEDLYKNKAERLGRNLTREAVSRCIITTYPLRFQDAVDTGLQVKGDVVVCGVDNNEARVAAAQYFLNSTSVVFIAVSEDADHGYVFIQELNKACYGCLFPEAVNDLTQHPCSPAVIDILKVVAGIATYAIDTLIMNRKRNWNYKEVFLSGVVPERNTLIEKRKDCPICGTAR